MKQETLVILVMFMAIGLVGVIAVETYNLPQVNAKGCLNSRAPSPHNNITYLRRASETPRR